jgi:hypothetical protein
MRHQSHRLVATPIAYVLIKPPASAGRTFSHGYLRFGYGEGISNAAALN